MAGNLEEARAQLRNLRAANANPPQQPQVAQAPQQPNAYPRVLPMEAYNPAAPQLDPLDEQLRAYLMIPLEIGTIDPKFEAVGNVNFDLRAVTRDFYDNKFKGKVGNRMDDMESEDLCKLGRMVIPMISSGFSRQGAAILFTLAYNARAPNSKYYGRMFSDMADLNTPCDKFYDEYSNTLMTSTGSHEPLAGIEDIKMEAAVYSYIALSMMRLFAKSTENFVKAWDHILKGFNKFYGGAIDFNIPSPNEKAISNLSEWFAMESRAKQSLYRLLYVSNGSEDFKGLKRYAFEMHLSNTGLHIVTFFVNLCKYLNCSSGVLLQILNVNEYSRQIECLVDILKLSVSIDANHVRGMWRYGRIFDETFMSYLQTKSCPKLVYILGEALKMEAPKSFGNFSNISQLSDISDVDKKKCKAIAAKVISTVRRTQETQQQIGNRKHHLRRDYIYKKND